MNRHPKPCRHKDNCKFLKQKICAFSHGAFEKENDEVNKHTKMTNDDIGELKNLVRKNQEQCESKIKILTEVINYERKKYEGHEKSLKDALRKKDDLEGSVKNEMKELHVNMEKLENSNKDL